MLYGLIVYSAAARWSGPIRVRHYAIIQRGGDETSGQDVVVGRRDYAISRIVVDVTPAAHQRRDCRRLIHSVHFHGVRTTDDIVTAANNTSYLSRITASCAAVNCRRERCFSSRRSLIVKEMITRAHIRISIDAASPAQYELYETNFAAHFVIDLGAN